MVHRRTFKPMDERADQVSSKVLTITFCSKAQDTTGHKKSKLSYFTSDYDILSPFW